MMSLTVNTGSLADTFIFFVAYSFGFFCVALYEEAIFRGYIMQCLFKKLPAIITILAQAVLFGLLHFYNVGPLNIWIKILNIILIGLIFGLITIQTESLMPAIGIHMMYNLAEYTLFTYNSYKFTRFFAFEFAMDDKINALYTYNFAEMCLLILVLIIIVIFNRERLDIKL
jgi:membrane protease YdiL (CAAX protease family)